MTNTKLVVIAFHNGSAYLDALLSSFDYERLVVDTGSRLEEQAYLRERCPTALFIPGGYCTEAYIQGYLHRPGYDHYFFMHDSMRVKERDFMPAFAHRNPVTAWIGFPMDWGAPDSPEAVWGRSVYGNIHLGPPPNAIFGPIFYANANAMFDVMSFNTWPPPLKSRVELQGSERGLSYSFQQAGHTVEYLEEYDNHRIDVLRDYPQFDKYRPNRP